MCENLTLVLGGASSGKSNVAEKILINSTLPKTYLASAEAWDVEMRTKIAQHRTDRGPDWHTIEAPLTVSDALAQIGAGGIVLFDCATMWLTNHLLAENDIAAETDRLLAALMDCASPVVVVSNEVGQGIVPENALARRFRIEQGLLNRRLAAEAATVVGVMAGLPFALKGALPAGLA